MIGAPVYYIEWDQANDEWFCVMDYEVMKERMKDFCEELVQTVFHPKRIKKICYQYDLDMFDYLELV